MTNLIPWQRLLSPMKVTLWPMVVGLLESMFTATIVDDLTDITSDKNRECKGQGVAPAYAHRTYYVTEQVFFGSTDRFSNAFDIKERLDTLTIDLREAHFRDITAVVAVDKVVRKLRREGVQADVIGMNLAT